MTRPRETETSSRFPDRLDKPEAHPGGWNTESKGKINNTIAPKCKHWFTRNPLFSTWIKSLMQMTSCASVMAPLCLYISSTDTRSMNVLAPIILHVSAVACLKCTAFHSFASRLNLYPYCFKSDLHGGSEEFFAREIMSSNTDVENLEHHRRWKMRSCEPDHIRSGLLFEKNYWTSLSNSLSLIFMNNGEGHWQRFGSWILFIH